MQVTMLEIIEHWFIHENGKQKVHTKRNVTLWTDKDDLILEVIRFIDNKSISLDEDLVFAARSINLSDGLNNWEKLVRIAALFNRFSKFAAETNSKKFNPSVGSRTTWLEISSIESKLRGSVFE